MILIIENNKNISNQFKDSLEIHELKYKIVNSAVEAYKLLCVDNVIFDIIITNLGLPDENGVEIIKYTKSRFDSIVIIYSGKKYNLRKSKFNYDYLFHKKDNSPSDIIEMIINGEIT